MASDNSGEIVDRLQRAVSSHNPPNIREFMMRFLWLEEYGSRWLCGDEVPIIGLPSAQPRQPAYHHRPSPGFDVSGVLQAAQYDHVPHDMGLKSSGKRGNLAPPTNSQFPTTDVQSGVGPNMKRRSTFEIHTESDLHTKLLNYRMTSGTEGTSEENEFPELPESKRYVFKRQESNNSLSSKYNSDDDEPLTPSKVDLSRRSQSFSVYNRNQRSYIDIDSHESDAIRRRYSISTDRRRGISSEILDATALSHKPPINPKTDDEKARLDHSTANNVLFSCLEYDDKQTIYDAMFEKKYKAGEAIITQGADGDNFYIIDSGECEIYQKGETGEEKLIKTVSSGESFGELALIYGQPRAATVRAKTEVRCWAIDRLTFRKIMMDATLKKRSLYEEFLKKVTILQDLTPYERMTVADALVPCEYKNGSIIIHEGSPGHSFYILVEGEVKVTKRIDGEVKEVARLTKGNYFGELALLFDQPRAATVVAVRNVKCIKMDRKSFNNLLGPCMTILKRNLEKYNEFMTQKII